MVEILKVISGPSCSIIKRREAEKSPMVCG